MIKNSNIIITGTSAGIGHELTKMFLTNGNKVWGCSRKENKINNKNYFHTKLDLSNDEQLKSWVKKVEKQSNNKIDIFISNAAIFKRRLISLESFDEISRAIKINLTTPILLTNMISKIMIQNKKGLIIFFSSVATVVNEIGSSTYASSKSGIETFSNTVHKEMKKLNIKVATFRILYLPTALSNKLNIKEIKILKNKFKTNRFGKVKNIFKEINKIYNLKRIPENNIYFDKLKNEKNK